MRQNRGKRLWYILSGAGLLLMAVLGIQYNRQMSLQQGIAEKILRFHVLANSDSEEDQTLKLAVRDAVGAKMAKLLEGAESRSECEERVQGSLPEIERIAREVVAEEGYDYEIRAELGETHFPIKRYGSFVFPSGTYEALNVVIGEGEGHNWWCVMYPNLCFSGTVYEVADGRTGELLRETLSAEEYRAVLSSENYEIRFRYLSFLLDYFEENE